MYASKTKMILSKSSAEITTLPVFCNIVTVERITTEKIMLLLNCSNGASAKCANCK